MNIQISVITRGQKEFGVNTNSDPVYRNDPKFSDRQVWTNSAGAVWSESTLFAILSASFGLITLW